jgi:hypothetical protein
MLNVAGADMLECAKCHAPIDVVSLDSDTPRYCRFCRASLTVLVFPAFAAKHVANEAAAVEEGESSCFYHTQKKAFVPCDQCGRFLCSLCRVEFLGQNWCPNCIENHRKKVKLANLDNYRLLYDNVALWLAIVPLLIWPFTFITGPAAIFIALRYWRAPSSLVPRTKIRFVIAILFGLAQTGGCVWLITFLILKK